MGYPQVNHSTATILLVVNCFLPGVGTMIAGVIDSFGCNAGAVCKGLLQLILAPIIIGWIWCKTLHFLLFMMRSTRQAENEEVDEGTTTKSENGIAEY